MHAIRFAPLLLFAACSTFEKSSSLYDSVGGANGPPGADQGGAEPAPGLLLPEKEVEELFQTPVATGRYLWVANPTSGRVAYIDAVTLEVVTVPAGNAPTHVAAIGQLESTIVINVLSQDATLLALEDGALNTTTYPLAAGMNAWSTSADGRFAIAWSDARKIPSAAKTLGFQDLTVVDLQTKTSTVLSVGYRPTAIRYNTAATTAFAVTSDGISVVALDDPLGPMLVRNVRLAATPEEQAKIADVTIRPDGSMALARITDSPDLVVANLATGIVSRLTLADTPTDLDLTATGNAAIAVMRGSSTLGWITLGDPPSVTTYPLPVDGMGSASLASGAEVAVLYTNATDTEDVTIASLSPTFSARASRVYARVLAAYLTPLGTSAVILHDTAAGQGAFSLLPLAMDLPAKIVSTVDAPRFVALSADSTRALVVAKTSAFLCKLPSFATQEIKLSSMPLTAGIVEGAKRAFISQSHPAGRVSFIDLQTGEARTLTGFELQARIVGGQK